MSDDTPTERFDPKSAGQTPPDPLGADPEQYPATRILPTDDVPTTVNPPLYSPTPGDGAIPPAQPPATRPTRPAGPTGPTPPKKSRTLMWWLIGIGAALLVTVIVLLVMLLGNRDDGQPAETPAPTASETPVPTPTETTPPEPSPTPTTEPAAGPTFATFSAPASAECQEGEDEAPLTFSWSSTDAVRAYLGVGTQNAAINPTVSDLEPTATYSDLAFDCGVASQVYTVTLEDAAGRLASNTVTITR